MSLFSKKDFSNTKWYILEKVFQLIAGIYITPKLFNNLGAFSLGELEVAKAIVSVLSPLFVLGLSAICIRELVLKPNQKYTIIGSTLLIRLCSFIVLAIGLTSYTYFTNTNQITNLVIIISLSYLFKISDVFEWFLIANKNYKYVFGCKITTLIVMLSLQYYGIKHELNTYYFASILVIEWILQTLIFSAILMYYKPLKLVKIKASINTIKQLLKSAFPLLISNLIIVFYIAIDDFFINHFLNSKANGVFSVVQFLVIFITWNIGAAFVYGLYPALADSYSKAKLLYKKQLKLMSMLLVAFGLCIGIFYTFFGDYLIETFYTSDFYQAKMPLKIFAWAPLFIFIGMLFEKHLLNQNKLQRNVYRFIIGCIVNIILCYILIPKYQLIGAAWATLLGHFITNIGFIFYYKEYRVNISNLLKTKC